MADMVDDGVDEVKIFRKNDADELAGDSLQSTAQLNEDKQDVAFEAEMETATPVSGGLAKAPFSHLPLFNPMSPVVAALMSPYASPAYAAANFAAFSSPQYQYQMYCNLMRGVHLVNQLNGQPQPGSMPQTPIDPTRPSTSTAPGTPMSSMMMSTPKRKRELREAKKDSHIKKPLNAFMWFMKENRQKVLSEEGNASKQSAELNTILGKMWHDLPKEEQQKYYEKAKEERENHAKLYPNWSARENYAVHKKKRKKREKSVENMESKKCRARFGMNNTDQWCKHCKRKKRCLLVRDTESPTPNHAANGHPATPGTPMSAFGSMSRPSSTSSDDDDHHHQSASAATPKPGPLGPAGGIHGHGLSALSGYNPLQMASQPPGGMPFPSPSLGMFNFGMPFGGTPQSAAFANSVAAAFAAGGSPQISSAASQAAPTLQFLN